MSELDILKEYSGKKPPKHGVRIVVSPVGLALIGLIVLQWSALMHEIEFQIHFKRRFPVVPQELKKAKLRREASQQINFLRQLSLHLYKNERPTAVREFKTILDNILVAKKTRDALVHGTFALMDNNDPNTVVVIFKNEKVSFSVQKLREVADQIGFADGSLKDFDNWVNYEKTRSSFEKLFQQERQ